MTEHHAMCEWAMRGDVDPGAVCDCGADPGKDWRDVPHTHGGTDCGGGSDCPARGPVTDDKFAHEGFTHKDGRQCIWITRGYWFTPYDVGGEGEVCDRQHPETNLRSHRWVNEAPVDGWNCVDCGHPGPEAAAPLTDETLATWRAEASLYPSGQRCNGIHDRTPDARIIVLVDRLTAMTHDRNEWERAAMELADEAVDAEDKLAALVQKMQKLATLWNDSDEHFPRGPVYAVELRDALGELGYGDE